MGLSDNDTALNIWMQAHDETGPGVTSAEGKFSKLQGTISKTTAVFAVLGATATAATGFLGDAARASAADEASTARLRKAIEDSGVAYDDVKGKVEEALKQGHDLAFTHEQVRDSLALLTAESGSSEEAFKRQTMAMDLARGMGIDLHTAAKLLGKVTDENIKVLGKYGIHVAAVAPTLKQHEQAMKAEEVATLAHSKAQQALSDELLKLHGRTKLTIAEQLHMRDLHKNVTDTALKLADAHKKVAETTQEGANQAALFAAVQQKFGGQAEAYGQSTSGSIDKVKDSIHEWMVSIGGALGGAQPFVALLPGLTAGMTLAGAVLGPVAGGLLNVAKSEQVAALASRALQLAMGPIGLALLAITAVVALLAVAWANNWGDIRGKTEAVIGFLKPLIKGFADFFGGVFSVLATVVGGAVDLIMKPIQFLIDRVKDAINFLIKLGILHADAQKSGSLTPPANNGYNVRPDTAAKHAAQGYDGWVNKPTWFLTGEGGKPEHVKVTPQGQSDSGGLSLTINALTAPLTPQQIAREVTWALKTR